MALNIRIGKLGLLDMLKFSKMPDVREAAIQAAPADPLPASYASNAKAAVLHPRRQEVVVSEILQNGPDAKTFVLQSADGGALAPFRAGQYVSVAAEIGQTRTTRPYSLCGSPDWAWRGVYHITVKRDSGGFVSPWLCDSLRVGQKLAVSAPEGNLYYEPLRDCKKVVALAGGSGITPFVSMAYAIRDGYEDFDLTILCGARTKDAILYRDVLDKLCAECGKLHAAYVLSDETADGFEHGFLTAELIKKYAGDGEYSVFLCGPQAMYRFLDGELDKLGLDRKHVRRELFGAIREPWKQPGFPEELRGRTFRVTVLQCGGRCEIPARADEPLLTALERAGIKAPSRCRSGECGWCRSRLLHGDVFIPALTDGRRFADTEYGYIHPCASFPITDLEIEVPAEYLY